MSDKFSDLPGNSKDVKNGHIWHIYSNVCEFNKPAAVNYLLDRFPSSSSTPHEDLERLLRNGMRRVIDGMARFQKLTNPVEFERYEIFCEETFDIQPRKSPPIGEVPLLNLLFDVSPVPDKAKSPVKTRQISDCTSCQDLRRTAAALRAQIAELRERLREQKVKPKTSVSRVNQKIRRKDDQMKNLKAKMSSSALSVDLENVRAELTSVKNKHQKMKSYRKSKSQLFDSHDDDIENLESRLEEKNAEITSLQTTVLETEEKLQVLKESNRGSKQTKMDNKTYSPNTRLMVFDCLMANVSTLEIPGLIRQVSSRCGVTLTSIPSRTRVEFMARELGIISDLQTAEALISSPNTCIGFDATTQEGTHVNEIHFTMSSSRHTLCAAVDELPGGTAADYHDHVCNTVDHLASVYSHIHKEEYSEVREKMVSNISTTLTDRCPANHATVLLLNETWNKSLHELNCHLHPLDSIATKTRQALKECEREKGLPKKLKGVDSLAADIVVQLDKMRFRDGKGDPKGFKIFLEENNLPKGLLPRYRGNRLHILFHSCGLLFLHYDLFVSFLGKGVGLGGLRACLREDFNSVGCCVELQVIGLLGKLLTGPWMRVFYTADTNVDHVGAISKVVEVLEGLQRLKDSPMDVLSAEKDLFGEVLPASDCVLKKLLGEAPKDKDLFSVMMERCASKIIDVLQGQYKKYFVMDVNEVLLEETKSAKLHNIDSEEMMGMFSALQQKAGSATLHYVSSKLRAKKNKTVKYLDCMDKEKRASIVKTAISLGQTQTKRKRAKQPDLVKEIAARLAEKEQKTDEKKRRDTEKSLKALPAVNVTSVQSLFPALNDSEVETLIAILGGKCVGQNICHVWYEDRQQVLYSGLLEKVKTKGSSKEYTVSYWLPHQNIDESTQYVMSAYALATDFILKDLSLGLHFEAL